MYVDPRPRFMTETLRFASFTRFTFALIACISMLALAGCGKKDAAEANATNDSSAGDSDSVNSGDDILDASQMSEVSFNSVKDLFAGQVAGAEAQAETLRKMLVEWPDDGVKAELDKLDAKVADVRKTYDDAKYPAGVKTMQVDVPKKLGETMEMVAAVQARIQDVIRAKTGIGGGGG